MQFNTCPRGARRREARRQDPTEADTVYISHLPASNPRMGRNTPWFRFSGPEDGRATPHPHSSRQGATRRAGEGPLYIYIYIFMYVYIYIYML